MQWCAMVEMQPELSKYFTIKKVSKYMGQEETLVIVPKSFEFDDKNLKEILSKDMEDVFYASDLSTNLSEDGNVLFGVKTLFSKFCSFNELIAEIQKDEEQISMNESLKQALKRGITTEDVIKLEKVENEQNLPQNKEYNKDKV